MADVCVDTADNDEKQPIATTSFHSDDTPHVENEEIVEENEEDIKPPVLNREDSIRSTEEIVEDRQPTPENIISISHEDLAEAGVDIENINNLSNEQLVTLMEVAERRAQRELTTAPEAEEKVTVIGSPIFEETVSTNSDAITIVISNDGSLKVKDAIDQVFFFPAEQLNAMNIDINNLTNESISQIVNEAMPSIQLSRKRSENVGKVGESPRYKSPSSVTAASSSKPDPALLRLIGEQIEIRKNNGKTAIVTIRYVKNGGAFKVQFEDGHFEWITEDQILVRQPTNDHDRYHSGSIISTRVVRTSRAVNALKRVATSGTCREAKRTSLEPNFCCPICDNKVYQKEPAWIVIRIPACDSCTKEKVIVLDEDRDGDVI